MTKKPRNVRVAGAPSAMERDGLPQGPLDHDELKHLIERTRAGDAEARRCLFEHIQAPVHAWVRARMPMALRRREESADLVQTGIREALGGIERFEWQGPGSFHRWLCGVVEHQMHHHARYWTAARRNAREVPLDAARSESDAVVPAPPSPEPGPRTKALEGEERERLRERVRSLPDKERRVVDLSLQGLSDSEVADRLDMSKSAVQRARAAAMRKLASQMHAHGDGEHRPA